MFKDQEERKKYMENIKRRISRLKKLSKGKNSLVRRWDYDGVIEILVRVPLKKNGQDFFNLRESLLLEAEKEHKMLVFHWAGKSLIFSPEDWRKDSQITFQKFKYQTPIKLIGNYLGY